MNKTTWKIILKDFYITRKIWCLLIIPYLIHFILLEALITSSTGKSIFYPYLCSGLYILILIACAQYLDAKHDFLIHSLSIKRTEQIRAKYAFVIIMGLISFLLTGITGAILKKTGLSIMNFASLTDLMLIIAMLTATTALTIPISFLIKALWGLVANISILLTSIFVILVLPIDITVDSINPWLLLILQIKKLCNNPHNIYYFFIISFALFLISYLLTNKLYTNKDS